MSDKAQEAFYPFRTLAVSSLKATQIVHNTINELGADEDTVDALSKALNNAVWELIVNHNSDDYLLRSWRQLVRMCAGAVPSLRAKMETLSELLYITIETNKLRENT